MKIPFFTAVCALVCAIVPALAQNMPAPPDVPKTSDQALLDRARILKRPAYPDDGVDGTVVVRLLVAPSGEVLSSRAVAGPDNLRKAAADAAASWEFESTDSPDTLTGYLLFRFARPTRYAAILGVRDEEVAVAPPVADTPAPVTEPVASPSTATPAPATAVVERVADGVLVKRAKKKVAPQYPANARSARVEGTVIVEVEIDESGRVVATRPVAGHALLRDAAASAARQWAFAPSTPAGSPHKTVGTIAFNFKL